jgi:phage minor structural protein
MIRVYDAKETAKTDFIGNAIKFLTPLVAEITKVDNGDYFLEVEDVLDNLEYYQKGMVLVADTPWDGLVGDAFRCDNPRVQNNRISCKAWHLSYDSKNYIINEAKAENMNCNDALDAYKKNTDTECPFSLSSDIRTVATTEAKRKSLFDVFADLANVYSGHWDRRGRNFSIKSRIGQDRGVVLAYGKNITDFKVEENWDNVCTKILPYTTIKTDQGDAEFTLEEVYVELGESLYDVPYTKAVKFENNFTEDGITNVPLAQEWLHAKAVEYLEANKYPQVNYSVSANIDNISDIGDTVHIRHPKLSKWHTIPTNVISVKYDVIAGKYTAIEFGNFRKKIRNLVDEVVARVETNSNKQIATNNALLQAQLEEATASINSVLGESSVINNGSEILIVDRLPKEKAVHCLKINSAGIGFSSTGIYGTFNSAWTIDGTLNMQAINVINFTASLIKGGTLKLGGTGNSSGTFELYDNSNRQIALMDKEGVTVYAQNGDYVKLNAEVGFAGYNRNGTKIYWADGDVFRMRNAEVENEIKIAGKIKIVPVSTSDNVGVGFVAIN